MPADRRRHVRLPQLPYDTYTTFRILVLIMLGILSVLSVLTLLTPFALLTLFTLRTLYVLDSHSPWQVRLPQPRAARKVRRALRRGGAGCGRGVVSRTYGGYRHRVRPGLRVRPSVKKQPPRPQASTSSPCSMPRHRQIKLRAASSLGQPRAASGSLGQLANGLCRPCSLHRFGQEEGSFHARLTILPPDDVFSGMLTKLAVFQAELHKEWA